MRTPMADPGSPSRLDLQRFRRLRRGATLAGLGLLANLAAALAICPGSGIVDLDPGRPVFNLAAEGACANGPIFSFDVPNDVSRLVIETGGGVGNANLFAKLGGIPTELDFDYFSGGPGNGERIEIASPDPGTWYFAVDPRTTFAGVRLVVNLGLVERSVRDREPARGIADARPNGVRFFSIEVPPGSAELEIATSGGTGNADLFVRFLNPPTSRAFDGKSVTSTNAESVHILSPDGGNWKIAVVGATPFADVTLLATVTPGGSCLPGSTNLCLFSQRFKVEVNWTIQNGGGQGLGQAIPGTDETGYFWFFSPTNTELVVKVLDGRAVNGRFWVFFGGLSDVEYEIRVTDTTTGAMKSYRKPSGTLDGGADTEAF